ncbi:MAG: TRAP transporter substrate-binding protein DctP [Desulfobacterales bacterium]|nr:TRAP transporter substrate-binding protein DctP [Desulfobacterales bacterium]
MNIFKILFSIFLLLIGSIGEAKESPKVTIKLALLIPKGTEVSQIFETLKSEVSERTKGAVDFKIYWGGVQGDENEVLRKIRGKQLHGGIFSGYGLGQIAPEIRVTEIPYLLKNYEEVDYVRKKLEPTMNEYLEKKGFIAIAWNNAGFVYGFSTVPITSLQTLRSLKCWIWGEDPLAYAFFKTINVSPVSLSITDVLTSVSSKLIDAAAAPPLGAVAFQWHLKFKYVTNYPIINALGALIITKEAWEQIPKDSQNIIIEMSKTNLDGVSLWTRQKNEESIEVLKKAGIKITEYNPSDMETILKASKQARENLVGKLYSKELLDKTLSLVEEYRKANPNTSSAILK